MILLTLIVERLKILLDKFKNSIFVLELLTILTISINWAVKIEWV